MEPETRLEGNYELEFGEFYRALRWYTWRKYWGLYCILIFFVMLSLLGSVCPRDKDFQSQEHIADVEAVVIPVLLAGLFYWSVYSRRAASGIIQIAAFAKSLLRNF